MCILRVLYDTEIAQEGWGMLRGFSDSSLALDGLTFSQNYPAIFLSQGLLCDIWSLPAKGRVSCCQSARPKPQTSLDILGLPGIVVTLTESWHCPASDCHQARSRLERLDEAMHGGQTVPQSEFSDSFCMCACVWLRCECLRFLGRYHLSSRSLRFVPIGAGELWNLWRGAVYSDWWAQHWIPWRSATTQRVWGASQRLAP